MIVRLLTAIALAVAGLSLTAGSATAAGATYCSGGGVNVAIDFGVLGGGVQKGCGSGTVAAAAIQSAGFPLGYIQTGGMSGFVCTVSGKPMSSQGGCTGTNGNGYWALFLATPGGHWAYASLGANSQPVSSGQTVSFTWQAPGGGQRNPGTAPAPRVTPTPRPTPTATSRPSSQPSKTSALVSARGVSKQSPSKPSPSPSSSASGSARGSTKTTQQATATTSPSTWSSAAPALSQTQHPSTSSSSDGSLPWWVPVGVVIVLVLGAGGAWWRKRAGG